jgi:hypothetical protein
LARKTRSPPSTALTSVRKRHTIAGAFFVRFQSIPWSWLRLRRRSGRR